MLPSTHHTLLQYAHEKFATRMGLRTSQSRCVSYFGSSDIGLMTLPGRPSRATSPDTDILLSVLTLTSPHDHQSLLTFSKGSDCLAIVQGCADSDDTLEHWIDRIEESGGRADEELNIVLCCIIAVHTIFRSSLSNTHAHLIRRGLMHCWRIMNRTRRVSVGCAALCSNCLCRMKSFPRCSLEKESCLAIPYFEQAVPLAMYRKVYWGTNQSR